ncbi:MAG TPA: hypothetical protein VM925_12245 [Labilithrix sp.]|nr:hypothetical protein [Labilithrix sp.]
MGRIPFAIAFLSVIVALGAALPAYVRLLAGPKAHVCHCDTGNGHAHCECPICFPELDSDLGRGPGARFEGRCGDDDRGWRAFSDPALLPPALVALVPHESLAPAPLVPQYDDRFVEPPDPRPPRAFVSRFELSL